MATLQSELSYLFNLMLSSEVWGTKSEVSGDFDLGSRDQALITARNLIEFLHTESFKPGQPMPYLKLGETEFDARVSQVPSPIVSRFCKTFTTHLNLLPSTIHHSPFTIHHSLFTIHRPKAKGGATNGGGHHHSSDNVVVANGPPSTPRMPTRAAAQMQTPGGSGSQAYKEFVWSKMANMVSYTQLHAVTRSDAQ